MNLKEKLKEFNKLKPLSAKTIFNIACNDGQVIEGNYYSYVSALDNEPEEAEVDITVKNGDVVGILESEIKSIEVL